MANNNMWGTRKSEQNSLLFLAIMLLCSLVQKSSQVFRFCHRGVWHQLQEQDCPYGLFFKEQLQTPCYYTMDGNSKKTAPRIWPTLCEEPFLSKMENVSDAITGDGFFLAQKNGQIRMVQFVNTVNDTSRSSNLDDLISLQSCEDRCYRDIFDDPRSSVLYTSSSHESSDSLEAPYHITRPKLHPNDLVSIRDQTLRLGDYLFDQIAYPEESPGPKLRIVDLFKRSIKIMGKTCQHPFVSSNFLNRVLIGFLFLVQDSGVGEIEDISVEDFEEIMVALNGCDEKAPDFRLEGTVCETNAVVKEVIKILPNGTEYSAPFQLTQQQSQLRRRPSSSAERDRKMVKMMNADYEGGLGGEMLEGEGHFSSSTGSDTRGQGSFPYDELDVFTEAAWSAVQVTHATCFATFKPNANMHHRYVSAMEQLFSGKIQDRWRNPTRLIDSEMWGTWFLSDVDLTFTNLQACIRAAYLDAPFVMRLDRPIDPVRSPSVSSSSFLSGATGGITNAGSGGSMRRGKRRKRQVPGSEGQQDLDAYWDTYEANGGIRFMLLEETQCFQNPDDRNKAVGPLKDQCKVTVNM